MRSVLTRVMSSAAVVVPLLLCSAPIRGIERQEVLEQMKKSRPQDLKVLIEEPDAGGPRIIGIYGVKTPSFTDTARSYQLWEESPADLNIYFESVDCSASSPVRVKRKIGRAHV